MRIYGVSFVVLTLLAAAASAQVSSAPSPQPAATVPLAPMPEAVYRLLKAGIESHEYAFDVQNRTANLAALEAIKKSTLPDFARMRLVRVDALDNQPVGVAWSIRLTDGEMTYYAFQPTPATLDRKKAGKIEDADVTAVFDATARYAKNSAQENWHPAEFGAIRTDLAEGKPSPGGLSLLDQAIAAAWLGKNDHATALLEGALRSRERALVEYVDSRTWPVLDKGIEMLKAGAPRPAVLQVFEQAATANDGGGYAEQLRDMVAQLKIQIADDTARAKKPAPNPANRPIDEQVQFYIDQFEDIDAQQFMDPGEPIVLNMGKATAASDALVALGRPALPALIALLDDRRTTRSVGYMRTYDRHPQVLRYQDIAIKCIEAIADIHFYSRSHSGSFLSNETKEIHDAVVADVRSWWKAHGQESAIQWQIARLESGTIYERLNTLHKIEKMDPTAVNAVQVLRHWSVLAREDAPDLRNMNEQISNPSELAAIAEELAAHKNFEMLPEMQRLARRSDTGALAYLVHWGGPEDFQFVRIRLRQAISAEIVGLVTDENQVIEALRTPLKECQSPLAVPVLVETLDYRNRNGLLGTPQGGVNFGIADECMESLIQLTAHNEGFVFTDPPETRNAAVDKWTAWWKAQGEAAYVATHPEVAKVLAPITPATTPAQ